MEAVEDVVTGLVSIKHDYIKFPETEAQLVETRETFKELSDLPNVAGAIDCTHVTIKAPTDSRVDYFSRFQRYDIIVQAVADGKKRFLDVAAGFPGSLHDAHMLRNSRLYGRRARLNCSFILVAISPHTFLDCWLCSLDIFASHRSTRYFTWSSVHRSCIVLPCLLSCFVFPSVEVLAISHVGVLVPLALLPD